MTKLKPGNGVRRETATICSITRPDHGNVCGWGLPGSCTAPATHHVRWVSGCAHLCTQHKDQMWTTARQRRQPITVTPLPRKEGD